MVCVKFAKGLILDIRILKLLISYKSKIHVMYKIERKIQEIIHSWIDIIIQTKTSFKF